MSLHIPRIHNIFQLDKQVFQGIIMIMPGFSTDCQGKVWIHWQYKHSVLWVLVPASLSIKMIETRKPISCLSTRSENTTEVGRRREQHRTP